MATLLDWTNKDECGTRFPTSYIKCPNCGGKTIKDTWPPDYGSGVSAGDYYKSEWSEKHICLNCKQCFRVFFKEERKNGIVSNETRFSEMVPLVEKNGHLLTPHDLWREEYKEQYGKYPQEAYG